MVAITRTSMINSNNTQLNSDYDFSMLWKNILGWKSWILKAEDFILDKDNRRLSAVSPIAEAVILCTRTTSYPIGNQTFYAYFQFTGTIENISVDEGTKIFIEIKENLILDPSLISDSDGRSDYAKWFWIGEIKSAKNYPSHTNYLPLWEIQGGQAVDKRKVISIPALDAVATRTSTLESKVQKTEGKVEKLEQSSVPEFIGKTLTVWESYQNWDVLYDDNGTARKKIVTHSFNLGLSFSEGNRNIWEFSFTPNLPIKIEIEELKMDSADAYIVFGKRYFNSQNDVDNNPNDVYWKILVGQIPENISITIPSADRVYVSIVSRFQSYNKVFTCKSAKIIQDKKPEWPAYYPREVKAVGQKVICTLVGIHSDNKFISKETGIIEINKNIVGNASGSWIAPRDWLLFFQYTSSDHSRFNATAYINGSDVRKHALYWSQYMNNYMRDGIWILRVKKWETYTLRTVVEDYSYKSSLTLRYFISL